MDTTKDKSYFHSSEFSARQKHTWTKAANDKKDAERALKRAKKSQDRLRQAVAKQARDAKSKQLLASEGIEENPGPQKDSRSPKVCHICGKPGHLKKNCTVKATPAGDPNEVDVTKSVEHIVAQVKEQAFSLKVDTLINHFDQKVSREVARLIVRAGLYADAVDYWKDREVVLEDVDLWLADNKIVVPPRADPPPRPAPLRSLKGLRFTPKEFRKVLGFRKDSRAFRAKCIAASLFIFWGALISLSMFASSVRNAAGPSMGVHARYFVQLARPEVFFQIAWSFFLVHGVAGLGAYFLYVPSVDVTAFDVSHARDSRIQTNTHVPLVPNALRCHRYRYRYGFAHDDLHVCDHWATVALSEFGGGDVEQFLSNVHSKFLRCAGLNVADRDYETLKVGTTKFLRLYLTSERFQRPPVLSWRNGWQLP